MEYELIRSRRKTLALRLRRDGTVEVRSPLGLGRREIDRFVAEHADWIEKQRTKLRETPRLPVLSGEELEELKKRARRVFIARSTYFAPLVGVSFQRITVRCQKSKWGSCSGKGNLNFNCLLLLAPPEVLDYVVVHELCHRLEMNHSPRFWANVERVLPDYRVRRDWLKRHGAELMARAGEG